MIKYCGECGADLRDTNGVCPNCSNKYSSNGIINRVRLKEGAKEILDKHFWNIFKASFFVFAIMGLSMLIIDLLLDTDTYIYSVANLFRTFIFLPLTVGLINYVLKIVREEEAKFDMIFMFYDKRIFLVFGVSFLVSLICVLWSLLLIIPGIIAYLSYSLVNYILADNDNMSIMEILRESKRLTYGYKADIFLFGLSFLGWYLLSAFTMGIAFIYVIPYTLVASAMYYEELKKIKK